MPLRSTQLAPVLSHGDVDVTALERTLGYRLLQTHVGLVAWCTDTLPDRPGRLARFVSRVSECLGSDGAPLLARHDESTMWAWLPRGTDQRGVEEAAEPIVEATIPGGELWLALGEPATGIRGFRQSHHQALGAQTVALAASAETRCRVTAFSRLAAIALMSSDIDGLRAWVCKTLGGLAVDDDTCHRLRETLHVFLATGGSFTSTAAQLNLHKNTVQYRIGRAAEARGRTLREGPTRHRTGLAGLPPSRFIGPEPGRLATPTAYAFYSRICGVPHRARPRPLILVVAPEDPVRAAEPKPRRSRTFPRRCPARPDRFLHPEQRRLHRQLRRLHHLQAQRAGRPGGLPRLVCGAAGHEGDLRLQALITTHGFAP